MEFFELRAAMIKHNKEKGIESQFADPEPLKGRVVFKQSNFNTEYSEPERTYEFRSDNKYFLPNMIGSSIFAKSLEGDDNIRLERYLYQWEIEKCYLV